MMRGNIQDNLFHRSELFEGNFAGAAGGFPLSALNWFQMTSSVIKTNELAQK